MSEQIPTTSDEAWEGSERQAKWRAHLMADGYRYAEFHNPDMAARWHIWAQTPTSVWDEYRADGYTQYEAIRMEMSYAE